MKVIYPARITHDKNDKCYFVQLIDFKEAFTEGETLKEALDNASEVLTLTLEGRMDEKMKIPFPSSISAKTDIYLIAPATRVQSALLIKFCKGKHKNAELARILNTSWPAVARLEDPHHWPSLKQLEKLAAAIGQRVIINFEPMQGV